ncbi:MAG: MG2 domain-containing protein, partial [Myxococcota bacterium]
MRHFARRALIAVTLTPLILSGCHCGEALDVIQASPTGNLSTTPAFVELQFDRPLLDPDSPGDSVPSLDIRTQPPLEGTVSFPTPSSVTYSFSSAPAPATEVEVIVDAGLRSFDGSAVLKSDYRFSFVTETNRIERITVLGPAREGDDGKRLSLPERGERKKENLGLEEQLLVALRFPASIEQLERKVSVLGTPMAGGDGSALEFSLHFPDQDSGLGVDRFAVRPKGNWPKHTYLDVVLSPGLNVALQGAGSVGSAEEQRERVATYGPIDIAEGPECELCTPPNTLNFEFTTPVSCADVVERVKLRPKIDKLTCAGQPKSNVVRIEPFPKLASFTEYTVTVRKGVSDAFGQELAVKKTFTLKTGSGDPRFAHQLMFNVVERKQGGAHEEKVYKTSKLKVRGQRLDFKQAWAIIQNQGLEDQVAWERLPWWLSDSYSYGYYGGDCYWDEELDEEVCEQQSRRFPGHADRNIELSEPKSSELEVGAPDGDGWSLVQVPIEPYLEGEGGIVVLEHTPFDEKGRKLSNPVVRLLNITDVGLTARYSPNQMVVMAARLSDGSPVSGATVSVYAAGAKALDLDQEPVSATTNSEGVAVFRASDLAADGAVPNLQGQPLFVTAQAGDDEAFLWSRFTSGGNRARKDGPKLVGAVYTERGVYRPGEKVFYRAVVRQQSASGFTTPVGAAELRAERSSGGYYDSDNDEAIYTHSGELSDYGTVHGEFVVPNSARIGDYALNVKVGEQSIRGRFQVAEFRRAEMKVVVNTDASEYVRGDEMDVRVNADYLFGAPAAGLDVRWSLRRSWGYFKSKRFQGAVFSNSDRHYWYDDSPSYTEFLDEGRDTLDDNGTFEFSRRLRGTSARGRVENLVVSATVDDESGQSVSARRTVLVHPADIHVGLVPKGYIKDVGKTFSFDVVSVTPDDQPASGVTVSVGSR